VTEGAVGMATGERSVPAGAPEVTQSVVFKNLVFHWPRKRFTGIMCDGINNLKKE